MQTHNPWIYQTFRIYELNQLPEDTFGFIYQVTHIPTQRKYIGKKNLYSVRNIKLGKKELEQLKEERKEKGLRGRTPLKKKVIKESDWKIYYGSQEEMKELVKVGNLEKDFKREILECVPNKKLLTYYENKHLFSRGVIEPESTYINDNIEGRYFRKDFE